MVFHFHSVRFISCHLVADGTEPTKVRKNVDSFINYGKPNSESLAQLFVTLLMKVTSLPSTYHQLDEKSSKDELLRNYFSLDCHGS